MFTESIGRIVRHLLSEDKIIFINSPLQLINFVEYKNINAHNAINSNKNNIFITNCPKSEINKIIHTNKKINNDFFIDLTSFYLKLFFLSLLVVRFFLIGKFTIAFFGDFNNKFLNKIFFFSKKIIFLDDGTNIFNLKKRKFLMQNYIFFTFFKSQYFNIPKNKIVENKYRYIKKLNKFSQKKNNSIIILGSPFVSKRLMLKNEYIECLKFIKKNYMSIKILYFPHPKEDASIVKKLKLFKVIHSNFPIEIYLLNSKFLPLKIIGLNSTAFITIRALFNKKIKLENYFYFHNDNKNILLDNNYKFQQKIISYFLKYMKIKTKPINSERSASLH